MGLIGKLFVITSLSLAALFLAPGLPPYIQFEKFLLPDRPALDGKLAPNNILDKAEIVKVDTEFQGPESVAIRGDEIFTGIVGGELIRIKNGKVKSLGRMIEKKCEGAWDAKNCGRIAGVRFGHDGKLYVADAANGVFKVDVDTGSVETLVSMGDPIEGKKPKFPDDLDVAKDGSIYWSDASTVGDIDGLMLELMGSPTGRLVKYDPKSKKCSVLLNNLHFANGVQMSENEEFVLVSETAQSRVMRYYLNGAKKGKSDVFVENLPGLPDNIRSNGKGGFYIVMSAPRIASEVSITDLAGPRPMLRRFISRFNHLIVASLKLLDSFVSSPVLREWIVYVGNYGPIGDLENLPPKSIIVETDGEGNVIGSLQNDKNPLRGLSEIRLGKDYAYLGSPGQRNLYRIKRALLP